MSAKRKPKVTLAWAVTHGNTICTGWPQSHAAIYLHKIYAIADCAKGQTVKRVRITIVRKK